MLQQTQVSAVIGYYSRFMARFPDLAALANASQDEVLQYWSGLGYYSRARNLHHAAQTVLREHGGVFPQDIDVIQTLKGIGRSTAAAICVFAFNQQHTILDGNVKRVLARFYAIDQWTGLPTVEKQLWQLAQALLPQSDLPAYIQGLMDFGATLCTRSKPKCNACPMQSKCQAYLQNQVAQLPIPRPRKPMPERSTTMLLIVDGRKVLLQQRPNKGIWGGLWSLPEIASHEIASEAALQAFGIVTEPFEPLPLIHHSFTHYKLHITPQPLSAQTKGHASEPAYVWLELNDALEAAIPAPVRSILHAWKKLAEK